jgi:hypothetical protein
LCKLTISILTQQVNLYLYVYSVNDAISPFVILCMQMWIIRLAYQSTCYVTSELKNYKIKETSTHRLKLVDWYWLDECTLDHLAPRWIFKLHTLVIWYHFRQALHHKKCCDPCAAIVYFTTKHMKLLVLSLTKKACPIYI